MHETFFIDVWSDVICPFCYLGARQLDDALDRFEHREVVSVRHHAFELDPRAQLDYATSLDELVARKYSMPVARAASMHERLEGEALDLGMTWDLQHARATNTFDAHRLIALAATRGLGHEMSERLFRAYFSEGALVSDHGRLAELANEVGLVDAAEVLASDAYEDQVRRDEDDALERGITGVPAWILDGRFMVVGAQGADQLLSALDRAWARRSF